MKGCIIMEYYGTIVTIRNEGHYLASGELFCTTNIGINFYLISYNNGILKIEPQVNANLEKFALMVSKLFDPSSNFYGVKRVKFEFNGIPISVSAKKATPFLIVKQYRDKCKNQENNSK